LFVGIKEFEISLCCAGVDLGKEYLLVPIEQANTNHNGEQTKPFQPSKFIMEIKYCNLKDQGKEILHKRH